MMKEGFSIFSKASISLTLKMIYLYKHISQFDKGLKKQTIIDNNFNLLDVRLIRYYFVSPQVTCSIVIVLIKTNIYAFQLYYTS